MNRLQRLGLAITAGALVIGTVASMPSYATVPGDNAAIDITDGGGNPNAQGHMSGVSQDGRFVTFTSQATNLLAAYPLLTGATDRVYLRDRLTGTTELISQSTSGTLPNQGSYQAHISDGGRYVVFTSDATNLVSGDTNGYSDAFIRDRTLGTTTRVSVTSTGVQANNWNATPDVSADGQYVVWMSRASNLGGGGITSNNVYLKNMANGTITLISQIGGASAANADSEAPQISCEGRIIIFRSKANNFVSGDNLVNPSKTLWRTYIADTFKPTVIPQYIKVSGDSGRSDSTASVSCNGNYIAFSSSSNQLVTGDTNLKEDSFLYDRINDNVQRVSIDSSSAQGNNNSYAGSASNDGKYVVFTSSATNLISGDTNGYNDVFIRNTQTGTTEAVSRDSGGTLASSPTGNPVISSDGKYINYDAQYSTNNLLSGFAGYVYASRSGVGYDY